MAKLYPPTISGIIPAFCGGTLTVPFSMNKAVGRSEVGGFSLKVKTISNETKKVYQTSASGVNVGNQVTFNINAADFNIGQYYKIQLAYVSNDGVVGHYSTVGVIKYTQAPSLIIEGLVSGSSNAHVHSYTAVYSSQQLGDSTEKMYTYRWILRNPEGEIIEDTDYQLHDVSSDPYPYEATETYQINRDFPIGEIYTIQFFCTTTNGLKLHTPRYKLAQRRSIASELDVDLKAELDYDNGVVKLSFSRSSTSTVSGALLLTRANVNDAYNWEELKRFNLHSIRYDTWSFIDFTIEQGQTYQYSLQQYNENGIHSERILSNEIYADFEDAFLYDGIRQLCVRYNPKVATYKRNIPEGKQDTIGSKYAFITRNGNVNYKEFSLSGLISAQMDPDHYYLPAAKTALEWPETDLVSQNIAVERGFKNDVLDWLTDGKIKLLRTPTEGNYLVRLMNVSMSPIDQLGRMLHTFSCSAYELAEMTNDNLQEYGIVDSSENTEKQMRWASVNLKSIIATGEWTQIITRPTTSINVVDMVPGDKIRITFKGDSEPREITIGTTGAYKIDNCGEIINIEVKCQPQASNDTDQNFMAPMSGIITYSYYVNTVGFFGEVEDVGNNEVPCRQFIGHSWHFVRDYYDVHVLTEEDLNTYQEDYENEYSKQGHMQGENVLWHNMHPVTEIMDALNDVKFTVSDIFFLRAFKRETRTLYVKAGYDIGTTDWGNQYFDILYIDRECTQSLSDTVTMYDGATNSTVEVPRYKAFLNPLYIYEIREVQRKVDVYGKVIEVYQSSVDFNEKKNAGYYIDAQFDEFAPATYFMLDGAGNLGNEFEYDDEMYPVFVRSKEIFSFMINGTENINIDDTEKYILYHCDTVKTIEPNYGVIIEIGYPVQERFFAQEKNSSDVINVKQRWKSAENTIKNAHDGGVVSNVSLTQLYNSYFDFYKVLTRSLTNYKLNGGESQ